MSRALPDGGVAQPRRADLDWRVLSGCLTSARLHLVLLPTEACNFRCIYCYEGFRRGRMEPWLVRGLKRFLDRRAAGLHRLDLAWFGGEPLLAADIIEDVMAHVRSLSERFPSLEVASDVTTNGYLLTPALAGRLHALGVTGYHISFDGPREWHDRERVLARGGGTFDRLWSNLRDLRDSDHPVHVTLRLHVHRASEPDLPSFLDLVARDFGSDPRFDLFVRTLGRFGGPNDEALPTFETEEAGRAAVGRVTALAVARGIRLAQGLEATRICYAAMGNSFVLRADGSLNKCSIALGHPRNHVGRLRENGTVRIDEVRIRPWLRGLFDGDQRALACPMHGLADRAPASSAASA